jgi:hypothetical protein
LQKNSPHNSPCAASLRDNRVPFFVLRPKKRGRTGEPARPREESLTDNYAVVESNSIVSTGERGRTASSGMDSAPRPRDWPGKWI